MCGACCSEGRDGEAWVCVCASPLLADDKVWIPACLAVQIPSHMILAVQIPSHSILALQIPFHSIARWGKSRVRVFQEKKSLSSCVRE